MKISTLDTVLTPGESFELDRRRASATQRDIAELLGVSVYRVKQWERDERDDVPATHPGVLETYEWCWLMRRRSGLTLRALEALTGLKVHWLHRAERGETASCEALADWWQRREG